MAYAAKFYNGTRTLDVSSGTAYTLGMDFVPPAPISTAIMSDGLTANRYGGGRKFYEKYQNRDWSFTIRIRGASEQAVIAASNSLIGMLNSATADSPLMFGYRPNANVPVPLWGEFGQWKNYTVIHCAYTLGDLYTEGDIRKLAINVQVNLSVTPFAESAQMRLASAAGGIFEDVIGSPDGTSRGLVIPEATTNKVVNPVFGAATYSTGYTANNVIMSKNIDPRFCLPGLIQSARVIGAPGGTLTFSIAVGNTNVHSFSFYVKREDGAPVAFADCAIYYNGTKTTTFTALGDGWYRADWIGAGIAAATTIGLNVQGGRKVYIGGIQVEEKAAPTPLAYGDLLGCAWTGTAHASTSTRTAGIFRVPVGDDTAMRDAGSVTFVWKSGEASTLSGDRAFVSMGVNTLRLDYVTADDKFKLYEATNSADSGAQTFTPGTVFRIVGTWSSGGLNLYINGTLVGTNAQYITPDFAGNMTIGSSNGISGHPNGIFILAPQTYDHELTQGEVTALDTELAAVIAAGKRPAPTPWLWTKDGDNVVDNCDDATRDNWCVIGGVPGNAPAGYKHVIRKSDAPESLWLGGIDLPDGVFIYPATEWFHDDFNSTANAAYCGGGYDEINAPGSPLSTIPGGRYSHTKLNFFIRMAKTSTTGDITITPEVTLGTYQTVTGKTKTVSLTTTPKIYHAGELKIPPIVSNRFEEIGYGEEFDILVFAIRFVALFTVNVDYFMMIPGKIVRLDGVGTTGPVYISFDGETARMADTSTHQNKGEPGIFGDRLEILPSRYNLLWAINGADGQAHTITDTTAFTTFVTPRWSLL